MTSRARRSMDHADSFGLTCRTATGITEPTVRCVMYIHSFPTTSRTQEADMRACRSPEITLDLATDELLMCRRLPQITILIT